MKQYTLPVIDYSTLDESNRTDLVIEKSEQPEWILEYEKHIKSKEVALPIKIHPLLMCDKDTAMAEYDRLYDILKEPYESMRKGKEKEQYDKLIKYVSEHEARMDSTQYALECAGRFARIVIDVYLDTWIDIKRINEEEYIGISEDVQDIKHIISALHNAKYIKILQDSNDRICAVRICGKSNNVDTIARGRFFGRTSMDKDSKDYIESWESEKTEMLNDRLLNDILTRIENASGTNVRETITPKHRNWDIYVNSVEYCLTERLNYWIEHKKSRYDIRKEKRIPISECKPAYQALMNEGCARYLPAYKGTANQPSFIVANFICRILNLDVDIKTFVDIVQHS